MKVIRIEMDPLCQALAKIERKKKGRRYGREEDKGRREGERGEGEDRRRKGKKKKLGLVAHVSNPS